MAEGWIKLYRSIRKHWIWEDAQKLKWWLDILLQANHQDKKVLLGNELILIERGSFHTSELKLSKKWGVSKTTVRKFLELLESDQMIVTEKSKKGTTIKVSKYEGYQGFSEEEKTDKKPQKNHNVDHEETIKEPCAIPQKNHKVYTNNNDKELYKNYKNEEEGKEGEETPPPPPSIPPLSDIQKTILNQFGDVTYKTWFLNAEVISSDKEVKFIVPNGFTRDIISDRFREPLETILNRKVFIDVNS